MGPKTSDVRTTTAFFLSSPLFCWAVSPACKTSSTLVFSKSHTGTEAQRVNVKLRAKSLTRGEFTLKTTQNQSHTFFFVIAEGNDKCTRSLGESGIVVWAVGFKEGWGACQAYARGWRAEETVWPKVREHERIGDLFSVFGTGLVRGCVAFPESTEQGSHLHNDEVIMPLLPST